MQTTDRSGEFMIDATHIDDDTFFGSLFNEVSELVENEKPEADKDKEFEEKVQLYKGLMVLKSKLEHQIKPLADSLKLVTYDMDELERQIDESLTERGIKKIENDGLQFSYRSSTSTVITDESLLPDSMFRKVPDALLVKKAIQMGTPVEGAYLRTTKNLQVKVLED